MPALSKNDKDFPPGFIERPQEAELYQLLRETFEKMGQPIPGELDLGPDIRHLGGLYWYEVDAPKLEHACSPQSAGWFENDEWAERCACGAARLNHGEWTDVNSRVTQGLPIEAQQSQDDKAK